MDKEKRRREGEVGFLFVKVHVTETVSDFMSGG